MNSYENRQLNYFIDSDEEYGGSGEPYVEQWRYEKICTINKLNFTTDTIIEQVFNVPVEFNTSAYINSNYVEIKCKDTEEIVIYYTKNNLNRELRQISIGNDGKQTSSFVSKGSTSFRKGKVFHPILICSNYRLEVPSADVPHVGIFYKLVPRTCLKKPEPDYCPQGFITTLSRDGMELSSLLPVGSNIYSSENEPAYKEKNEMARIEYDKDFSVMIYRGLNWVAFHNDGVLDVRNPDVGVLTPKDTAIEEKTIYNLTLSPVSNGRFQFYMFYETTNYHTDIKVYSSNSYLFTKYFENARYMLIISDYDCPLKIQYNDTDKMESCPATKAKGSLCFNSFNGIYGKTYTTELAPTELLKSISPHSQPYVSNERPTFKYDSTTITYGLGGDSFVNLARADNITPYGWEYMNYYSNQRTINAIYILFNEQSDARISTPVAPVEATFKFTFTISKYSNNNDSNHEEEKVLSRTWVKDSYNSDIWQCYFVGRHGHPVMSNVKKIKIEMITPKNMYTYTRGVFVDNVPTRCEKLIDPDIVPQCSPIDEGADINFDEGVTALSSLGIDEFVVLAPIRE